MRAYLTQGATCYLVWERLLRVAGDCSSIVFGPRGLVDIESASRRGSCEVIERVTGRVWVIGGRREVSSGDVTRGGLV